MPGTKRKTDAAPWQPGNRDAADASVVTQLAALKRMTVVELKAKWESLFGTPAPNNSRSYLELRLSYRIQELTLGGLSRETRRTLDLLADEIDVSRGDVICAGDMLSQCLRIVPKTSRKSVERKSCGVWR